MATRYSLSGQSGKSYTGSPLLNVDAQGRLFIALDATTDEGWEWDDLIAPQGLTGTLTVVIKYYMASATSGSVRFEAQIEAITYGTDAIDMDGTTSFDTANSNGQTVPSTAQHPGELSITMTNADNIAAGDGFRLRVSRDADGTSGTDNATGDCRVVSVEVRDAA